LVRKA